MHHAQAARRAKAQPRNVKFRVQALRPPCPTPAGPTPAARPGLTSLPAGTTSSGAKTVQIGRVYLTNTPHGDRFVWSITINDHVPKVPGAPSSGSAATLDKATAAMLRSYARMRAKAGLRQPD